MEKPRAALILMELSVCKLLLRSNCFNMPETDIS